VFAAPSVAAPTLQSADPATRAKVNGWADQLRTGWMPNRGQIAGAPNVLYTTTAGNAQIFVTTTGLSHVFLSREDADDPERESESRERHTELHEQRMEWSRLDVKLAGASIRADRARAEDPLRDQGGTNFYLPQCPDGALNVPTYGSITFPEVYPGVDWTVRSVAGGDVHQDFIVRPGADASRIRLEYAGATSIEVADDGHSLRVRTALGEVREGALACSQDDGRTAVGARFRLTGSTVAVELDGYDRSKPLVIDPPMVWSTYYGGTTHDGPRAIWCDNQNDVVYVVGYTYSNDVPVLNAGGGTFYQGIANTPLEAFIWKFTQQGTRLWATYYGGNNTDFAADCQTDPSGNLYVCGYTNSTNFPTQVLPGAYNQTSNAGATDAFLLKFNPAGVRQWATYYGGSGADEIDGLTIDATGRVFVTGSSASTDLPLLNPGGGAYYQTSVSTLDAWVGRFSATDALEWSTFFGGANQEDGTGIAVTATDLYVVGYTQSTDLPVLDPGGGAYYQGTFGGSVDAFIAHFTPAGVRTWSTYYGGSDADYADECAVDASGRMLMVGDTYSSDFPTLNPGSPAYFQGTNMGIEDLFLVRFDAAHTRLWATYYGGSDIEIMGGADQPLALDASGTAYVTCMTGSTDLPTVNPGGGAFFQGAAGGIRDAMIGEFGGNGQMLWSTYLGSNLLDFGTGLCLGSGGCLFATGESSGPNNFTTMNPGFGAWYQSTNAGGDDGYIVKFCSPSSACCLDNNCIAVTSQSQCTAMGGIAFYPNQPCSTVVCTINCTICGRKFNDLNRNGVQDPGEPGLPGWTIALYYPGNGPLYATAVTGANGDYCFTNLPCGSWTVAEQQQSGWVQTAPAGMHNVTLGTGTTQNNVNFGNVTCNSAAPCVGIPPHVAAWWPFDDGPGATTAMDVTRGATGRNVAQVTSGGGSAGDPDALCFSTPADHASVPAAGLTGLEFGAGSFAIAAWVEPAAGGAGRRTIVDKRSPDGGGAGLRGWALYLDGLQSYAELATGGAPQIVPGPALPAGAWSHLAVTIDRATGQGRWYLNGDPVAASSFTPVAGSVSIAGDLTIGQANPKFGPAPGFQGCIGDLALFNAALDDAAAKKAWGSPTPVGWCPEFALMPSVKTFCKNDATVQLCFNIVNNQATPQSYHWSLAGLPVGPGCSVAGPTQIVPPAGTVTVPGGGTSAPICVTITRPAGLTTQNATSCFSLTFLNDATGICRTSKGTLRADYTCWCANPTAQSVMPVPVGARAGGVIAIPIENPCDPIARLAYTVHAEWLGTEHPDPQAVSLNGLPPGTAVTGEVTGGSAGTRMTSGSQIDVAVTYPNGYDPGARYEIVLEADTDGDGTAERLCGTVVQPVDDANATVGAPSPLPPTRDVRLVARPNPFLGSSTIEFELPQAGSVALGVYDLGGRLVRSLAGGVLPAGPHRLTWDGHDASGARAPAGVYFVRLTGGVRTIETKLVKMQ
jgi:hypothetical protein